MYILDPLRRFALCKIASLSFQRSRLAMMGLGRSPRCVLSTSTLRCSRSVSVNTFPSFSCASAQVSPGFSVTPSKTRLFLQLCSSRNSGRMSHGWGYGPNNGPDTWADGYPVANGPRQSPINIVPKEATFDPSLKQLKLQYDPNDTKGILNNGHSFQVDFTDDTDSSTLTGGPITGVYRLKQFHCHWGSSDDRGSEHTVNGISFPCELHLVHWNTKYPSFGDAAKQPDGLAVVGVFLRIGAANPSLQKILDCFTSIKNKGKQSTFSTFDTQTLLPPSLEYWTYDGSLTTPPLLESVTWIVLKQGITVSPAQMEKFRGLQFCSEGDGQNDMVDNFRPPQPLKGRRLRANFKI